MILFGEGYFFFVLVIACLPAVVLGLTERSIKWYGLAASVFIVCLALGTWQGMLRLAGYCLFKYILIKCWTLIEEIRRLVRDLASDGVTVMVSSHLLGEIDRTATVLGIIARGTP